MIHCLVFVFLADDDNERYYLQIADHRGKSIDLPEEERKVKYVNSLQLFEISMCQV